MSIQLRSSDRLPEPSISMSEPLLFDCPRCGGRLHTHNSRTDVDGNGRLEQVYVYLCFTDGFFSFRNSKGLVYGL
jgi:hypothetical protein